MQAFPLVLAGILLSVPCAAREPSAREARQCIIETDADLIAGFRQEETGPRSVRNVVHHCSEYYRLDYVNVEDTSQTGNLADVKVSLQYTVVKQVLSNTLKRCTGILDQRETHAIPVGTVLRPADRTISMQLWASGWKCKNS